MNELKSQFQEQGFIVVSDFLSLEKVATLREESNILLESENDATLRPNLFLKNAHLSDTIFSGMFNHVLKQLSPEYRYFLPNFTVRKDLYIGWHTDDEFVESDDSDLPGVLQCNIYLQENTINQGGGIDVAVGTHRLNPRNKKLMIQKEQVQPQTVRTFAGDLFIFDYRIIHRSTIPLVAPRPEPRLAVQWTVCKSLEHAERFMRYFVRRQSEKLHLSDFTKQRALSYFHDAVKVSYPASFREASQKLIEDFGYVVPAIEAPNDLASTSEKSNAEYILRVLEQEGIKYFFMVPGKLINPLMSCYSKKQSSSFLLQPIIAAHEAGAAAMADGYARATDHIGVCMAIDGPGTANAIPMLTAAQADGSPVLLIAGHTPNDFHSRGAIQDSTQSGINTVDMLKPVCKRSISISHSSTLPRYLSSTLQAMVSNSKGTGYLSIAKDVLLETAEVKPTAAVKSCHYPQAIDHAAVALMVEKYLRKSVKIAFLVGSRAMSQPFYHLLKSFSEEYAIPVATTISSKSLFDEEPPRFLGLFGYSGHKRAQDTFLSGDIDVVVLLGFDVTQWTTLAWHNDFLKNTFIQVDKDSAYLSQLLNIDFGIAGDETTFLKTLKNLGHDELNSGKSLRSDWLKKISTVPLYDQDLSAWSRTDLMHPAHIVQITRQYFPKDTIAVADAGVHRSYAAHYWKTYGYRQFFAASTFAPMGWAVPASIGISLANPDHPIIVFSGDGCMLMSGLEIQTAVKLNLDITFVVFNNGYYGASYFNNIENESYLTKIPCHDWAKIAEGLGAKGFRVHQADQLEKTLISMKQMKGPKLIDILCDHEARAPSSLYANTLKSQPCM